MNYDNRDKTVGKNIRALRKAAGMTQEAFAKELHMSESSRVSISQWERGEKLPGITQLMEICDLFGCEIGFLFGDYDQRCRSVADICEYTNLSEAAINLLHEWTSEKCVDVYCYDYGDVLSKIIEHADFKRVIRCASEAAKAQKALQQPVDETILENKKGKDVLEAGKLFAAMRMVPFAYEEVADLYAQRAVSYFQPVVDSIAGITREED